MLYNNSIIEQLKANNPFLSIASPLPWENNMPDISQLNSDVSANIEQLIRNKRREPSEPLSGLIFGGQGMGKTHMLTRLLRRLRKNAWHAVFVNVRVPTNPKRIMQEVLAEMCICLAKTHSSGRSQFDMVISEMMNVYHERRAEDGFSNSDLSYMKNYLKRDMPSLNRIFLKCILLYLEAGDELTKSNIIEWMREGLDDEDSLKLGLPMRDLYSMEDAACESEAKNIIASFGTLMAYAGTPMIVCFDQLDAIKNDKELIEAWGNTVGFLMNDIAGILPLCFIKEESWDESFHKTLDLAIVQRLKICVMKMKGCSVKQAQQLIHDRIASSFSEGAEEMYSWLMQRMSGALHPDMSPRSVIEVASKTIALPPSDPIKDAYEEERRRVQDEPQVWPPNAEHIKLALSTWLSAHVGFQEHANNWKYIKLLGEYGDKKLAFIILMPKVSTTAIAGLNEGLRFMKEYPASFCCYIMEMKAHRKTGKKFAEKLAEFEKAGGYVLRLDDASRVQWYALAALLNRINNGDVNIFAQNQSRAATLNDAEEFFRGQNLVPGIFREPKDTDAHPQPPKPQPEPPVSPDVLKVNLVGIIKASPMKLLTIDKAVDALARRKIRIPRDELLAFLNADKKTFRLYTPKRGEVMLGLV